MSDIESSDEGNNSYNEELREQEKHEEHMIKFNFI